MTGKLSKVAAVSNPLFAHEHPSIQAAVRVAGTANLYASQNVAFAQVLVNHALGNASRDRDGVRIAGHVPRDICPFHDHA